MNDWQIIEGEYPLLTDGSLYLGNKSGMASTRPQDLQIVCDFLNGKIPVSEMGGWRLELRIDYYSVVYKDGIASISSDIWANDRSKRVVNEQRIKELFSGLKFEVAA